MEDVISDGMTAGAGVEGVEDMVEDTEDMGGIKGIKNDVGREGEYLRRFVYMGEGGSHVVDDCCCTDNYVDAGAGERLYDG